MNARGTHQTFHSLETPLFLSSLFGTVLLGAFASHSMTNLDRRLDSEQRAEESEDLFRALAADNARLQALLAESRVKRANLSCECRV